MTPLLFLHNLKVVDLNKKETRRGGILINRDRILKIIPEDKIKKFFNLPKIDLQGNFVLPGFTDSHTHLLSIGIERQRIDLSNCRSIKECLEMLRAGEFNEQIWGVNWDESKWKEGRWEGINRKVLDRITKKKPIIMRRVCGHFAICNTFALKSIPKSYRLIDWENGYLYEDSALYLNQIFPPSEEMYEKAIEIGINEALNLGITSIHEITDKTGFGIYQKYQERLKLRVSLYLTNFIEEAINSNLQSNFGNEFLKFSGIKFFMDGSIGARTAAIKRPYRKTNNYGKLLIAESGIIEIIKKAENNSLQLMLHSIGDRATEIVLRAFQKTGLKKNPMRHRLEHIEILTEDQIKKIAQLGLIASMQPNFLQWQSPGGMYEKNLGARYKKMNCFKKLTEYGVRIVFGSDCMPLGPLNGIKLVLNHPNPEVRLSPAEALKFYTQSPHLATFDEREKGAINHNKLADLVVVDKNPLIMENLKKLNIKMVFVGGRIVFKKD
uniref:Amidohydrolase n=1 Tax=candidate division WOR-3 bacterium TaxID=2052148 RepID=A0A7C4XBL7_UNCW3